MERGKVHLVMEDVRVVDCMREILATFVHPAQTKVLQMELEVHGSCPESIHTDRVLVPANTTAQLFSLSRARELALISTFLSCLCATHRCDCAK
jgi:hypothetical protein